MSLFRPRRSIFRRLCRNLRRGLPAEAGLDLSRDGALPGAADGEYYFARRENGRSEAAEQEPPDIAPLCRALSECWAEERETAVRREIRAFFTACPAIPVVEPVQAWVVRAGDRLAQGEIYTLALALVTEAAEAEVVKFGLALLELFDTEQNQAARDVLLQTARHEEFTLFALFNIRDWADANAQIWQLARQCHGWGKIHAVDHLEALTPEIESWLLCHGWKNTVSPAYSALACAVQGDLPGLLRRSGGTAEELAGMNAIVAALLDEEHCVGISAYADPFALLALYLEKTALHMEEVFSGAIVRRVRAYALEHPAAANPRHRQTLELCAALLNADTAPAKAAD